MTSNAEEPDNDTHSSIFGPLGFNSEEEMGVCFLNPRFDDDSDTDSFEETVSFGSLSGSGCRQHPDEPPGASSSDEEAKEEEEFWKEFWCFEWFGAPTATTETHLVQTRSAQVGPTSALPASEAGATEGAGQACSSGQACFCEGEEPAATEKGREDGRPPQAGCTS